MGENQEKTGNGIVIYKKKTPFSDRQLIRYHAGDAGLDIIATKKVMVNVMQAVVVQTSLFVAIPEGCCGIVTGRSGLWFNHHIFIPIGVIDSGYRGEVLVKAANFSHREAYVIKEGDRIAQMLILPIAQIGIVTSQTLPEADRGENGFGSTGA